MPIYEFVCRECGTQFEHMQSFSAKGHPPCPNCQSQHINRMLSRPAIHFKGSGWYINDSKGTSKQSANGGAGSGESAAGESAPKPDKADATPAKANGTSVPAKESGSSAPAKE